MSRRQALGSTIVLALSVGAVVSLDAVDEWVGDLVALLWVSATMLLSWLVAVAVGRKLPTQLERAMGALLGALTVLLPVTGYLLVRDGQTIESLPQILTVFTVVACVNGGMAYPVGVRLRSGKART